MNGPQQVRKDTVLAVRKFLVLISSLSVSGKRTNSGLTGVKTTNESLGRKGILTVPCSIRVKHSVFRRLGGWPRPLDVSRIIPIRSKLRPHRLRIQSKPTKLFGGIFSITLSIYSSGAMRCAAILILGSLD